MGRAEDLGRHRAESGAPSFRESYLLPMCAEVLDCAALQAHNAYLLTNDGAVRLQGHGLVYLSVRCRKALLNKQNRI